MFERAYALHSDHLEYITDDDITKAVSAYDSPRAQAAVACMTTGDGMIHFLIEYWKETCGDSEQDSEGAVDRSAAVRKPRRKGTAQNYDTGAETRVEPESVALPLGTSEVTP